MRLELKLNTTDKDRITIPVNYQYPISAWIYKTIAEGNHSFASFLHNKGFSSGTKSYKLFTFSHLRFPARGFKVEGDRMMILSGECKITLSFMVPEAIENFITGLFKNQKFTLGDQISQAPLLVSTVEVIPEPSFNTKTSFRCLSPVIIAKKTEEGHSAEYLAPEHRDFERILFENLIHKYSASVSSGLFKSAREAMSEEQVMLFKLLNTPRRWGITIKDGTLQQTKIIGYTFDFHIEAPVELINIGFSCGFGEKNALGMGCVDCFR